MNERLKQLAEQAGIFKDFAVSGLWLADDEELTRFAELIRLDETKACAKHYLEIMRDAVEQAVLKEREACAKLCDELANNQTNQSLLDPSDCAKAIRQRGEAELAKPEHPLDKKADNARDLGLDYEPNVSTKQQNVNTSEERVQISDKNVHERKYPDHETYCGRCGACTYKPWVGLTNEEIHDFDKKLRDNGDYCSLHFAWGISAKLKEKNT